MPGQTVDRSAAELVLALLFAEPLPERLEAVRKAASAVKSYEGFVPTLEAHGTLLAARRNLEQAGVELPAIVAPLLEQRAADLRDRAQHVRLTLVRFLQAARSEGLEVTLLGGEPLAGEGDSLLLDPRPLDLLVPDLAAGVRAGEAAGLAPAEDALPVWWHRRACAPLRLAPCLPLLCAIDLRADLHHPSLLYTVELPELFRRRVQVEVQGTSAAVLDPIDRLLQRAASLASQAGEALASPGRRALLAAAVSPGHPLRLGWILGVRAEIERSHAQLPFRAVVERARQWSAEAELRATLECIHAGLGFQPEAREWVRQVVFGLAAQASPASARVAGSVTTFDFRSEVVERLPRWIHPPAAFLARRYGIPANAPPKTVRAARARHAARVLLQGTLALCLFPVALLARKLGRRARAGAQERARKPQRVSELAEAWHGTKRAEAARPALKAVHLELDPEREAHRKALEEIAAKPLRGYGES